MIKLTTTREAGKANGVNFLVYGPAGIGKTVLCSTASDNVIISAESGLLSLADYDIPVIEIKNRDDCIEAYRWVTESQEAKQFNKVSIDSLSEIAEVLLTDSKQHVKDARQAYGMMSDDMSVLIRDFRDLKTHHVYFSAKEYGVTNEETGRVTYTPSVPGNRLLQNLPYFFDEVFAMKLGKSQDGTIYRYLQTVKDFNHIHIKDRSGKLDPVAEPNIDAIIDIIMAPTTAESAPAEEAKPEEPAQES